MHEGNKLQWSIAPRECGLVFAAAQLWVGENDSGEAVSWVSGARYATTAGGAYCHISLYLTREDLRGRGLGSELWARMLHDTAGCARGLDSVREGVAHYARKGFAVAFDLPLFSCDVAAVGAALARSAAAADGKAAIVDDAFSACSAMDAATTLSTVSGPALSGEALAAIVAYDASVTGCDRGAFYAAHALASDAVVCVARDAVNARVVGMCVVVPSLDAGEYELAPLLADSPRLALRLAAAAVSALPPDAVSVSLWPPSTHAAAMALARDVLGAKQPLDFDGLVRMYDSGEGGGCTGGGLSSSSCDRVFSVASPEFG